MTTSREEIGEFWTDDRFYLVIGGYDTGEGWEFYLEIEDRHGNRVDDGHGPFSRSDEAELYAENHAADIITEWASAQGFDTLTDADTNETLEYYPDLVAYYYAGGYDTVTGIVPGDVFGYPGVSVYVSR